MPDRARERLLEQSSGSVKRESTFISPPSFLLSRLGRPRTAQPVTLPGRSGTAQLNIGQVNMRKDDQAAPAA
jgi:hypothetical protein